MWPTSPELRENLEISESNKAIIITILIQFSIVKAPCDLLLKKKTKPLSQKNKAIQSKPLKRSSDRLFSKSNEGRKRLDGEGGSLSDKKGPLFPCWAPHQCSSKSNFNWDLHMLFTHIIRPCWPGDHWSQDQWWNKDEDARPCDKKPLGLKVLRYDLFMKACMLHSAGREAFLLRHFFRT